jgi:hypothetical protein
MSLNELFPRPLRNAGSKAIEDAIKKAISELAGQPYEVDIQTIDFGNNSHTHMSDVVKISFSTWKVRETSNEAAQASSASA